MTTSDYRCYYYINAAHAGVQEEQGIFSFQHLYGSSLCSMYNHSSTYLVSPAGCNQKSHRRQLPSFIHTHSLCLYHLSSYLAGSYWQVSAWAHGRSQVIGVTEVKHPCCRPPSIRILIMCQSPPVRTWHRPVSRIHGGVVNVGCPGDQTVMPAFHHPAFRQFFIFFFPKT